LRPAADALREPTIPTIGRANTARLPRTPSQRRGIIDLLQANWIFGFALGHEGDAHARGGGKLALASARGQTRIGSRARPRRARSGEAASAAPALPK
jgi:hypothetical protein